MDSNQESKWINDLQDSARRSKAFGQLVKAYQQPLYWHIRKMVLSHDDANDILQNTFMKAWSAIDSFRGDSKLSTWLFRIAVNEALTFLSNQRDKLNVSMEELQESMADHLESDPYFSGDEMQLKLQKAILSLPEKQRLVFNMKYFDDLKYEEMEQILGTSVGALKASYHYAVKKIEQYMLNDI
ncbi:MAG: RNA polymerase sigma factor [Microbacter sp.]